MKKKNWLWIGIATVLLAAIAVCVVLFIPKANTEIVLEKDSYTTEYGEIFIVPQATCTTGEEVQVKAYDADGYEVSIEYGTCTFEKGENKLVYSAGEVTKEVPVLCQDTIAPEISVNYVASAAVGHRYVVPIYSASDLSGVDRKAGKIELFKGDETTPVATESGQRVVVELADSYTLKITVGDMDGNIATTEYPIAVINRPETEVLEDFEERVDAYHDDWWGGGGATASWHQDLDGRGVVGLGSVELPKDGLGYAWFTGLGMDDLDLVGCTKLTFRFKVDPTKCRAVWFKYEGSITDDQLWNRATGVDASDWIDVTVNLVEVNFMDVNHVNIGIAIATDGEGECVWIDEVIADYRPLPEYKVTVVNGSINYEYDEVPEGKTITVTHNDNKAPEGKAFMYWNLNGERLYGDTVMVTDHPLTFEPVYTDLVEEERPIPNGAVMVTDFSEVGNVTLDTVWGSPKYAFTWWYRTYDGVAGVRSFGAMYNSEFSYLQWNNVLPKNFDYENYTHLTFRMKMGKQDTRAVWLRGNDGQIDFSRFVYDYNQWADVKVKIEDVPGFLFAIATEKGKSGEMVFIDQVYATVEPDYSNREKSIPSGAVMVEDFSDAAALKNSTQWGTKYVGATRWYTKLDGVYGVQAFGVEGAKDFVYTMWTDVLPTDFNYNSYTHITFRMKVKPNTIRAIYVGDLKQNIDITRFAPNADGWMDVTIPIKALPGMYFGLANEQAVNGEMIWLDQVFVTRQEDRSKYELPLPEGAVMVEDFSDIVGPQGIKTWGNGAIGVANWYQQVDDVSGVQALGVPENDGIKYTMWRYLLPENFEYSNYTHLTLRMKVNEEALRAVYLGTDKDSLNLMPYISKSGEWITVTIPMDKVPGFYIGLSNMAGASGDMVWLDQVYVTKQEDRSKYELPIPEGAVMVEDFSDIVAPMNVQTWGSHNGISQWYAEYEGVSGVLALGQNEAADMCYNLWSGVLPTDFDYNGYTHITFRVMVNKAAARALYLGTDKGNINLLPYYTGDMQWAEITIPVSDMPGQLMGFASTGNVSGEVVWLDQVWVSIKTWTVTIKDGAMDHEGETVAHGTTITLTHDDSKTPENMEFACWSVNGTPITGNQVVVTKNMTIEPVYKSNLPELEIPAEAVLVTDYSSVPEIINTTYGSHNGFNKWYAEFDGIAGVVALGMDDNSDFCYALWENVLPGDFDYSGYTHITFRMKVNKSVLRTLWLCSDNKNSTNINILGDIQKNNVWTTVTLPIESIPGFCIAIANTSGADGEMIWIDQVWVTVGIVEPEVPTVDELPIPSDATLVTDYSTKPSVVNNATYGSHNGFNKWHTEIDGVAGVLALGLEDNNAMCYALWENVLPADFDYSNYTDITFRMKVNKSALRALYLAADNKNSSALNIFSKITQSNVWITVTIPISDVPGFYVSLANAGGYEGELVWIDQVWVSDGTEPEPTEPTEPTEPPEPTEPTEPTEPDTGLTLPEGAVLVTDYSAAASPWNSPYYGSKDVGITAWYEEYDGVAGVQAFGVKENSAVQYTLWSNVLPSDFDYSAYTHITLRLKVDKAKANAVYLGTTSSLYNFLPSVTEGDAWTTVTLKTSDLTGYFFALSNKASFSGEMIWIDYVYVTYEKAEEGKVLVTDYAENPNPYNSPIWGTGAVGISNWYEEYDGATGVQSFGFQENSAECYTLWAKALPEEFNYSDYTHITIRMKVNKSMLRAIWFSNTAASDAVVSKNLLSSITESDTWFELSLPVDEFPGAIFRLANVKGKSGEMVWIDEVYAENRELDQGLPEGAVMVTDYSTAASPWNSPYYGSGAAGITTWYAEYAGASGVQAFGKSKDGYTLWSAVLPSDFDFSGYTYITMRLKVDKSKVSHLLLGTTSSSYGFLKDVTEDNKWTTVTLKLSDLPGYFIILNNVAGKTGEMVWIDWVCVH